MTDKELRSLIDDLYPSGWFHREGRDNFVALAKRLIEVGGFSVDDAIEILANALAAVAAEYGE